MIIKKHKGCLVAFIKDVDSIYLNMIPEEYKLNHQNRDKNKYHITIISSNEIHNLDLFEETEIEVDLFNFGLGKSQKNDNEVYYLVVYCNYFDKIRKSFDLNSKDYHITLGFKLNDIHNIDKSFNNIILKNNNLDLTKIYQINDIKLLQYIEREYNFVDDKLKILELKKNKNIDNVEYLISRNNYLGHIFKYQITKNIDDLKNTIDCYKYDINQKYDSKNIAINNTIKILNMDIMKDYEYRTKLYVLCPIENKIILHQMPRNFSWVIPNKLGGISALSTEYDLLALKTLGITKIYYFLEKPYFDKINNNGIEINYIKCENTKSPTQEDMMNVLETESFDNPILFGCLGGYGRTGTALACYLCHKGVDSESFSSERAISYLRTIRPKSIESEDQMSFIRQFSSNLYKSDNNPDKVKTSIKFIMLVGLPGSGKTTFCDLFMTCGLNVNVVTQDVMGRKLCEKSILKFIKESDITILDRTNTTKKDRKEWIELTLLSPRNCLCIYLNTPKFICVNRAKNRKDHPAIKQGGGERIINDLYDNFEEPSKDEGFSSIVYLEDQDDVREYLKSWKCMKISIDNSLDIHIHKFPRTAHLFNIGGATVDDRMVNKDEYDYFMNNEVQLTEKVDGAQMGFSIDENYKILVQNRSHYVNSKSHTQFKLIDKWIQDHSQDLYNILDENTILFGEWLYAKHSISYNNLPDYFLAFDLYNKKEKVFYNRKILEDKLENTSINIVRIMYEGTITKPQLIKLIEEKSSYTDGRVEGIYLKVFENDYVKYRSKLVRNDFICGSEHWSKHTVERNKLKF